MARAYGMNLKIPERKREGMCVFCFSFFFPFSGVIPSVPAEHQQGKEFSPWHMWIRQAEDI